MNLNFTIVAFNNQDRHNNQNNALIEVENNHLDQSLINKIKSAITYNLNEESVKFIKQQVQDEFNKQSTDVERRTMISSVIFAMSVMALITTNFFVSDSGTLGTLNTIEGLILCTSFLIGFCGLYDINEYHNRGEYIKKQMESSRIVTNIKAEIINVTLEELFGKEYTSDKKTFGKMIKKTPPTNDLSLQEIVTPVLDGDPYNEQFLMECLRQIKDNIGVIKRKLEGVIKAQHPVNGININHTGACI